MKKSLCTGMLLSVATAMICGTSLVACSGGDNSHPAAVVEEKQETTAAVAVDYSKGRAMNTRLGKGINLGNAWESASYAGSLREDDTLYYTNLSGEVKGVPLQASDNSYFNNLPASRYNSDGNDNLDGGWGNPIDDSYFAIVKAAGFNSVRIPVRWQHNSDPINHTVNPERLAGVKEDIQKAIDAGLAVIISFHWYYEIMFAANKADTYPDFYEAEKFHFASIWREVATAFESFPDSMLVYDILNEPTMKSADRLNEVMTLGYTTIRSVSPGKTIMFESKAAAKFAEISSLTLPQDGNIIFSGHYYEPYTYTHQGHGYTCAGDNAYAMTASADIKDYATTVQKLYPDVNGGHVPMNMGEFGVSGGDNDACGGTGPTAKMKAQWVKKAIEAAELYGLSWTYWGFSKVGGFEAYDVSNAAWYDGFPAAFGL